MSIITEKEFHNWLAQQGEHATLRSAWEAAESAILAKQREQSEPIAWAAPLGGYAHIEWGSKRPDDALHNMPLYTSPQPLPKGMVKLLAAAMLAYEQMRHTIAPCDAFTDALDALDAAITAAEKEAKP